MADHLVRRESRSTLSSVPAATASTVLLAANTSRRGVRVYNDSTAVLYLALAGTASPAAYTVQVPAGGYYEEPDAAYAGPLSGVWAAASGNARVTELT